MISKLSLLIWNTDIPGKLESGRVMVHGIFRRRGVLLNWILIIVGQGTTALAVGSGVVWISLFLSPCLWEMPKYRLKHCLNEPLNPKPTNQY